MARCSAFSSGSCISQPCEYSIQQESDQVQRDISAVSHETECHCVDDAIRFRLMPTLCRACTIFAAGAPGTTTSSLFAGG